MEGAVRIFAGELCRATLSMPGEDPDAVPFIVTPGGACCRNIMVAGALTEVEEREDYVTARVADPTGGFDLSAGTKSTGPAAFLKSQSLPSFVSVLGRVHLQRKNGGLGVVIRPDHVAAIDRAQRDLWVLGTADATMRRLEHLYSAIRSQDMDPKTRMAVTHYTLQERNLDELAAMVENAIGSVLPREPAGNTGVDIKALVLSHLAESKNPRGVAVQDIIDTFAAKGLPQEGVLAAIEALVVEDECYQPQKGFVRLL